MDGGRRRRYSGRVKARHSPAVLIAALACAGALAVPSSASASACASAGYGQVGYGQTVVQSNSGRVSGCMRVGPLRPGEHTVVLSQYLSFGSPAPVRVPPGKRQPRPAPAPREPAVALSLAPSSGPPGTLVTVSGRLAAALSHRTISSDFPTLCWDGCADGIPYVSAQLRWTSRRSFTTKVVVPSAPWIESGPVRVAPLVTGSYPIAITCLRGARGCPAVTEGSAPFHLTVAHAPSWCTTQAACASLRVAPASARPGQLVRLSGYAPLTQIASAGFPAGLEVQVLAGRRRGPQVRLQPDQLVAGRALLRVLAPPGLASLHPLTPIATVTAGLSQIAADPADPTAVAWCSGQTIELDTPTGTSSISTAGVPAALAAEGLSAPGGIAQCGAVAPIDDSSGQMTALAAAFTVAPSFGPPPFYYAALETTDDGATWSPLPVPPGAIAESFGGFRYRGAALEAVFSSASVRHGLPDFEPGRPIGELASADGQGFASVPLGCPAAGPCLTLGPYLAGNCAMIPSAQALLRSADGGRHWLAVGFPASAQACEPSELVATSARAALLIDPLSPYVVMRTVDGGRAWFDVGVPRLHGGAGQLTLSYGQGGLVLLPDGALLEAGGSYPWELLRPGARSWCRVTVPAPSAQRTGELGPEPVVIGSELWWLDVGTAGAAPAPTIHSIALGELACATATGRPLPAAAPLGA